MNREEISPTLDNLSIGGGSVSSEYDHGLKAMGLGELSSNFEKRKGEAALIGFLSVSLVLAACSSESRPTHEEAFDTVADQPPTLIDEMSDQGAVEVATAEFQVDVSLLESTEVFTQEPEATAEVAVIPTSAVKVEDSVPLGHFDGNNGEPFIEWRDEVANDMVTGLLEMGINLDGGTESVNILREFDENGVFRWMPVVDIQTDEGRMIFSGHMGQRNDADTGEIRDVLKGVCELNLTKWIEKGLASDVNDFEFRANYSRDSRGIHSRLALVKDGVVLAGCTDLRMDKSLFVAFDEEVKEHAPGLFPDAPDYWLKVIDGDGERFVMPNIGGEPSHVFIEGSSWVEVKSFSAGDGKLFSWDREEWLMGEIEIPESILAEVGEDAVIEDTVLTGEDNKWGVLDGEGNLKFFVLKTDDGVEFLLPPPPTPVPPPPPTLEATQTPLDPPPATEVPPPPTAIPTEVPPTPEQSGAPPLIAGQIPTLEQISQCTGGFGEAQYLLDVSRQNGWPLGSLIAKGADMTLTVQDMLDGQVSSVSVADVVRFEFRQVTDRSRYPFWMDSSDHVITYNGEVFTIDQVFAYLSLGTQVWVFDQPELGRVLWMYCDAVR